LGAKNEELKAERLTKAKNSGNLLKESQKVALVKALETNSKDLKMTQEVISKQTLNVVNSHQITTISRDKSSPSRLLQKKQRRMKMASTSAAKVAVQRTRIQP
jgi:hypothetical protein